MDEKTRKQLELKMRDLPTLSAVASQIIEVTNDPDSSVDDLKKVISMDQVVAVRILKAVNSAYYGYPRQIKTLSQAIVILGFNNVRSLALSVSVMDLFKRKSSSGFDYRELWKHAVGTAFCARALARMFYPKTIEEFFIAGLLHDIGLVAMSQCYPEEFASCLTRSKKKTIPLFMTEKERFGFDHMDVGHFMADNWLLPSSLVDTIQFHHYPHKIMANREIVYAVHAADILCKILGAGDYGDNASFTLKSIHPAAAEMFNIGPKGPSDEVKEEIDADMEEASGFISILT